MPQIETVGKAAAQDAKEKLYRLASASLARGMDGIDEQILQADYMATWNRISNMIPAGEKNGKWTAEKIQYAWYHGISDRYPDVSLDQLPWSEDLSQLVNQSKVEFYLV